LPFLLTVSQIGLEMGLLQRTTAAALVEAGVVSVLVFPPLALRLLATGAAKPSTPDVRPAVQKRRRETADLRVDITKTSRQR
jgi:hypothetical protein